VQFRQSKIIKGEEKREGKRTNYKGNSGTEGKKAKRRENRGKSRLNTSLASAKIMCTFASDRLVSYEKGKREKKRKSSEGRIKRDSLKSETLKFVMQTRSLIVWGGL